MQREAENIDRKNGGSSGEIGGLLGSECPGTTQDELKGEKRKEGKREKRGPRCRNNSKQNVIQTKSRNRQGPSLVIDPPTKQ